MSLREKRRKPRAQAAREGEGDEDEVEVEGEAVEGEEGVGEVGDKVAMARPEEQRKQSSRPAPPRYRTRRCHRTHRSGAPARGRPRVLL